MTENGKSARQRSWATTDQGPTRRIPAFWVRLTIPFFTLLSLAVAILSSANARFAAILRDRARSDYINTADGVLNNIQLLQSHILPDAVITAIATATFAIYGVVITVHPRWLRETTYAFLQVVVALLMIITGGYLADGVCSSQKLFERFGANDGIPYYGIMYYGGVAQAAYGSVLVFVAITVAIRFFVFDHYKTKRWRAQQLPEKRWRLITADGRYLRFRLCQAKRRDGEGRKERPGSTIWLGFLTMRPRPPDYWEAAVLFSAVVIRADKESKGTSCLRYCTGCTIHKIDFCDDCAEAAKPQLYLEDELGGAME